MPSIAAVLNFVFWVVSVVSVIIAFSENGHAVTAGQLVAKYSVIMSVCPDSW